MELLLVIGIAVALLLNFMNGLNDAANAISTIIATRVLTPVKAVLLASVFNLVGPLFFTTAVAKTVGKGLIQPGTTTIPLIIIATVSAVVWVYLTTHFGIPISATHAMIGGILGAALAYSGPGAVIWPSMADVEFVLICAAVAGVAGTLVIEGISLALGDRDHRYWHIGALLGIAITIPALMVTGILHLSGILSIVVFIVVSPVLGFFASFTLGLVVMRFFRHLKPGTMNPVFRRLQLASSAFYSIGHGSNDAQHAMGLIAAMLLAQGVITDFTVPIWVILASSLAISLGTLLGGWRVVGTMAFDITHLRPYQGFCAETGGGFILSFATLFGIPVSSTHSISGSIMGVGATKGYAGAVRWGIVREIVIAWILTIPCSALFAWLCFSAFRFFSP
jgi:PiT family inorganic phosphate transporter